MMDEKRLEREYRKWKRQTSPDLWERIDKNLKSHPERDAAAEEEKTENGSLAAYVTIPFSRGYMLFTAAAIILCCRLAEPASIRFPAQGGQTR